MKITPYMKSMFDAQEIVSMLVENDNDGANVRILANAMRHSRSGKSPEKWPGFAVCDKCGEVEIAHPMKKCVSFVEIK